MADDKILTMVIERIKTLAILFLIGSVITELGLSVYCLVHV